MKKKLYLVALAVVISAFVGCKKEKANKEENTAQKKEVTKQEEPSKTASRFKYTPKKPVNGKLKGVVELGASGFNSFIINVDANKNWEIKRKEFGNSLIIEGKTNADEVNKKLKQYIQEILEFGVDSKNIHFVMSSGAAKSDISKAITKELKSIGYIVNIVTPEQEGIYALKSVLPDRFKTIAYVVDIGSGNTKISYHNDTEFVSKETYGAKYFQKNVENKSAYDDVRKKSSEIPKGRRTLCFIIGGVPYQMAKQSRKDDERFTVLNTDVTAYADLVKKKGKKLESGLNIYKAIADETNCKKFVFDWDANFTIGFLLDLPKK